VSFDITSPSNERIKWLVRLRERKHRDAEGVFVVEGERLYGRALDAGLIPRATFVSGEYSTVGETVSAAPDVLDKASYRSRAQGIIGVFPQMETELRSVDPGSNSLILVAESIEKPGNLGAMLRTAAAAGATAVITVGGSVDVHNPNTLRSSTGAVFSIPIAVTSWDDLLPWLKLRGIHIVAASPDGEVPFWEADLRRPVAIVIGAEDAGLSSQAESLADELSLVPQADTDVDSLNASVAAAVFLFEAVRQRDSGIGRGCGEIVPR
jgi:TrmH family RNA methyltransferase